MRDNLCETVRAEGAYRDIKLGNRGLSGGSPICRSDPGDNIIEDIVVVYCGGAALSHSGHPRRPLPPEYPPLEPMVTASGPSAACRSVDIQLAPSSEYR